MYYCKICGNEIPNNAVSASGDKKSAWCSTCKMQVSVNEVKDDEDSASGINMDAPLSNQPKAAYGTPPPVVTAPAAKYCTSCGAKCAPEMRFCHSCGAKLVDTPPPVQAAYQAAQNTYQPAPSAYQAPQTAYQPPLAGVLSGGKSLAYYFKYLYPFAFVVLSFFNLIKISMPSAIISYLDINESFSFGITNIVSSLRSMFRIMSDFDINGSYLVIVLVFFAVIFAVAFYNCARTCYNILIGTPYEKIEEYYSAGLIFSLYVIVISFIGNLIISNFVESQFGSWASDAVGSMISPEFAVYAILILSIIGIALEKRR